jgi:hypothetical protein
MAKASLEKQRESFAKMRLRRLAFPIRGRGGLARRNRNTLYGVAALAASGLALGSAALSVGLAPLTIGGACVGLGGYGLFRLGRKIMKGGGPEKP